MKALNQLIVRTLPLVPKPIVRRIASRYVAGETLEDALRCVRALECGGLHGHARRPGRGRHAPRGDRADGARLRAGARPPSPSAGSTRTSRSSSRRWASSSIPPIAASSSRASSRPRAPRRLRPHRHGGLLGHGGDDPHLSRVSRARSQRRPRPAVVPAPKRRGRGARRRGQGERPSVQGHLRGAAGDRVSGPRGDPAQLHGDGRAAAVRGLLRRHRHARSRFSWSARSR